MSRAIQQRLPRVGVERLACAMDRRVGRREGVPMHVAFGAESDSWVFHSFQQTRNARGPAAGGRGSSVKLGVLVRVLFTVPVAIRPRIKEVTAAGVTLWHFEGGGGGAPRLRDSRAGAALHGRQATAGFPFKALHHPQHVKSEFAELHLQGLVAHEDDFGQLDCLKRLRLHQVLGVPQLPERVPQAVCRIEPVGAPERSTGGRRCCVGTAGPSIKPSQTVSPQECGQLLYYAHPLCRATEGIHGLVFLHELCQLRK
mmetsp:Transcript_19805/g.35329  ORF Transcript_19805/g.35329 Transcript_19805/m.35329 type:complete len:256 (-) Transcript_19805:505-1272(-)